MQSYSERLIEYVTTMADTARKNGTIAEDNGIVAIHVDGDQNPITPWLRGAAKALVPSDIQYEIQEAEDGTTHLLITGLPAHLS